MFGAPGAAPNFTNDASGDAASRVSPHVYRNCNFALVFPLHGHGLAFRAAHRD